MTEHKHAAFIRAIADGEPFENWEYKADPHGAWVTLRRASASSMIMSPEAFATRRKINTIRIGNVDVPEPMRTAPLVRTVYWTADAADSRVGIYRWANNAADKGFLKRGVVHSTAKAAEQHRRALILVSGGTP